MEKRNMVKVEAIAFVLLAFVVYTVIAFADHGLIGFFEAVFDNTATVQVLLDLAVAATIALGFIWRDAQKRGLPFAPYLVATIFLGSIGLLSYLLHRAWRGDARPAVS